jgi:hypothetical protein
MRTGYMCMNSYLDCQYCLIYIMCMNSYLDYQYCLIYIMVVSFLWLSNLLKMSVCWRLFQKRVVSIKLDIYFFLSLFTLPKHLRSPPVFSEAHVTRSLVLFVDRCLSVCPFSFALVLSVLLRFADSDYLCGIYKPFYIYFPRTSCT